MTITRPVALLLYASALLAAAPVPAAPPKVLGLDDMSCTAWARSRDDAEQRERAGHPAQPEHPVSFLDRDRNALTRRKIAAARTAAPTMIFSRTVGTLIAHSPGGIPK